MLLPFCATERVDGVSQLTNRLLSRLSGSLLDVGGSKGRPLSKHSVKTYMTSVNTFLAWAAKEGETVTAKAPNVRTGKRLRDVLTRREIEALENAAHAERDKLIVRVLADTGMRVGELCSLRVSDLRQPINRQYFLRIRGKGPRTRRAGHPVPLSTAAKVRCPYARRNVIGSNLSWAAASSQRQRTGAAYGVRRSANDSLPRPDGWHSEARLSPSA